MAKTKSYYCPVEVTIDVIGGKWKCTILWWLRRGAKRFSELKQLIPEISQQVLTKQLRELEADGLVQRKAFREVPPRVEYSLTDYGETVRPLTEMMCDWGKAHLPEHPFGFRKLEALRILVVGDEASLRDRLQRNLAIRGAQTTAQTIVQTSAIALSAADLESLDAIVIDFDALTPSSAELARSLSALILQSSWQGIAIALTASDEGRNLLPSEGFRVQMTKPIEAAELVAAIAVEP